MPFYRYRAMDGDSKISEGSLSARDPAHLENILRQQGLTLVDSESEDKGLLESLNDISKNLFKPKFNDKELLDFTYLIKLVVNSGIPILQGINTLMRSNKNPNIGHAAEIIKNGIGSGLAISEVMQSEPKMFPPFYVQMVKAGEASGSLDNSLDFLVNYLSWQMEFKKTVKSSLTYPVTVLSVLGTLMFIIFTFVFPKMLKTITGMGGELPLPTKIMIVISSFLRGYYPFIIALVIIVFIVYKIAVSREDGKRVLDTLILKIPLVGSLVQKINMSRYFKIVATLHASGVPAEKTFAIGAQVVSNLIIAEKMKRIATVITTGESISDAMMRTGFVAPLVVDMMAVAEKTGTLESTLSRASDILDKEVPATIKKVFSYVEPLTMLILGGMVLMLLLSVFLPIYQSVGKIKIR